MKRLLLMSSSRKGNMGYLEHASEQFASILDGSIKKIVFIPYAAVTFSFDQYEQMVQPVYEKLGVEVRSIHQYENVRVAIETADAVAVGGGNTFALLTRLYQNGLVEVLQDLVGNGLPYMGWSAGTNVACPTIRTTNDMPIVAPPSLNALSLVPFQINPHFISGKPVGHNGESREERLNEFTAYNPEEAVLAIREGSALYVEGGHARLMGEEHALLFKNAQPEKLLPAGTTFLLQDI